MSEKLRILDVSSGCVSTARVAVSFSMVIVSTADDDGTHLVTSSRRAHRTSSLAAASFVTPAFVGPTKVDVEIRLGVCVSSCSCCVMLFFVVMQTIA